MAEGAKDHTHNTQSHASMIHIGTFRNVLYQPLGLNCNTTLAQILADAFYFRSGGVSADPLPTE